jgi:hypothetical protein
MAKSDLIKLDGVVKSHNANIYVVTVDMTPKDENEKPIPGAEKKSIDVTCHLTGKLRQNYIRILVGDKVEIGVSPYDLTTGTITYRYK